MSFFTPKQDDALRQLLEIIMKDNNNPEAIQIIQENDLLDAASKDHHMSSIIEDVELTAESHDITLTNDEKYDAMQEVLNKYDNSSYDDFVFHAIRRARNSS